MMNPYPLAWLNHLTMPVATFGILQVGEAAMSGPLDVIS